MKHIKSGFEKSKEMTAYFFSRLKRSDVNWIKIFCIGRNKTGTTSLASFFRKNGYTVGRQEQAELLMEDWVKRDFKRIIAYCKTAEVFQDVPFSLPDTYKALDQAFPGSKYILTIRSSPEEWYNSLIAFHAMITSSVSIPPLVNDLEKYRYRGKYKGWLLLMQELVYNYPAVPLYDQQAYMTHYETHNASVIDYFRNRPNDLLVLNLKDKNTFEKLCQYIGVDPESAKPIPHLNRSAGQADKAK